MRNGKKRVVTLAVTMTALAVSWSNAQLTPSLVKIAPDPGAVEDDPSLPYSSIFDLQVTVPPGDRWSGADLRAALSSGQFYIPPTHDSDVGLQPDPAPTDPPLPRYLIDDTFVSTPTLDPSRVSILGGATYPPPASFNAVFPRVNNNRQLVDVSWGDGNAPTATYTVPGTYTIARLTVIGLGPNVLVGAPTVIGSVVGRVQDVNNPAASAPFNFNLGLFVCYYTGPSGGNWSNAANWSTTESGGGTNIRPGAGATAYLRGSTTKTINFDGNYSSGNGLAALAVDSSAGATVTLSQTANTMITDSAYIGDKGNGAYLQSGGTFKTNGALYVGLESNSTGTYTLNDPSAELDVGGSEYIGGNFGGTGAGTFNDFAGGHSISGNLILGNSAGARGDFNLAGFGALISGTQTIGYDGSGTFTQSGPLTTNEVFGDLLIGQDLGFGTYQLNSGTVTATGSITVGGYGQGHFIQNGGKSVASTNIDIGEFARADGFYTLNNGTTSAQQLYVGHWGRGTFTQTGGTANLTDTVHVGLAAGSAGTVALSGTARVSIANDLNVAEQGKGLVIQNGGGVSVGGTIYVSGGGAGTYSLNGGSLSAGYEQIGVYADGRFLQTGGINQVTNFLIVGNSAGGTYSQSGGTTTIGDSVHLGYGTGSSGSLLVSDTANLSITNDLSVSEQGFGTVIQTGGAINVGGTVYIGGGNVGSYFLGVGSQSSGSLIAGYEQVGVFTSGLFQQGNGTNTVNNFLIVGNHSAGEYDLNNGVLNVSDHESIGDESGGHGVFRQAIGTNSVGGALYVGNASGSQGSYVLSGGVLVTGNGEQDIGFTGAGAFVQTNGSNTVGSGWSLNLGYNPGGAGTYEILGGTTHVTGGCYVGGSFFGQGGSGTLNVSGGTMSVDGPLKIYNTAGSIVNLSGGLLSVATLDTSGHPSLFNWTGGSLNIASSAGSGVSSNPATLAITGSSGLNIVSGGALGASLTLGAGMALNVTNTLSVSGTLTMGGGSMTAGVLNVTPRGRLLCTPGSPGVIRCGSLSSPGLKFDLADSAMIDDYSVSSPRASIQSLVQTGYANGAWNGGGISSSAAAAAASSPHKTALGVAEAGDLFTSFPTTFDGQSVDSTTVLVRYTLSGDSNLDGTVGLTDFTFLAANFNGTGKGWLQGDYNYDGKVDLTDFTLLASNFNQSLPGSAGSLGATVPEPTALLTAVSISAALLRRRVAGGGRVRHRLRPQADPGERKLLAFIRGGVHSL